MTRTAPALARTARILALAAALLNSPSAWAICLTDYEPDGYGNGGAGCSPYVDCGPFDATVNPGVLEDLTTSDDDDCNGSTGAKIFFSNPSFGGFSGWSGGDPFFAAGDKIKITSAYPATKNLSIPTSTGFAVTVGVDTKTGGADCYLYVKKGATWYPTTLSTTGTVTFGSYEPTFNPGDTIAALNFSCAPGATATIDWVQIVDAETSFPSFGDLELEWEDTRTAGGGGTVSIARGDDNGWLYLGSDVGGVARYNIASAGPWETVNGFESDSLLQGGAPGVWDILPTADASDEVYALTGDTAGRGPNAIGLTGGLWFSADNGDNWMELGNSYGTPTGWTGTDVHPSATTDDDVGGFARVSQCPGVNAGTWDEDADGYSDAIKWSFAAGRRLQAEHTVAETGDVIYIANDDDDALGVSIYDEGGAPTICAVPTVSPGQLPAQPIGAILRVDVVQVGASPIPVLVVGYRGRTDGGPGLYICELDTSAPECDGSNPIDCWPVDGSELMDVRDLDPDPSLAGDLSETDLAGVLVADGGMVPSSLIEDPANPGAYICDTPDSAVYELVIDGTTSTLAASVVLLGGSGEMDSAGTTEMTGVAMDPNGDYMYAMLPRNQGSRYSVARMYRADAHELHNIVAEPYYVAPADTWVSLSTLDLTDSVGWDEKETWEIARMATDLETSDHWLGESGPALPTPFPARTTPGQSIDLLFYQDDSDETVALVNSGVLIWHTYGLADAWPDEPEGDVLWTVGPDLDPAGYTYQSVSVHDVDFDKSGQLWQAAFDIALVQTDLLDWGSPSAQVDCLWQGWHAASNSVDAAFYDQTVWATISDDGGGDPHYIGVVRTGDSGEHWEYAGAGYESGDENMMNIDSPELPGSTADGFHPQSWETMARLCRDNARDNLHHGALPMGGNGDVVSATWFGNSAEPKDFDLAPVGSPAEVEALSGAAALVLFHYANPDSPGGLFLTLNGGQTWEEVPFDGAWTGTYQTASYGPHAISGSCDMDTTYTYATMRLIHPGGQTWWDPGDVTESTYGEYFDPENSEQVDDLQAEVPFYSTGEGGAHFEVLVALVNDKDNDTTYDGSYSGADDPSAGSPGSPDVEQHCAVARVSIDTDDTSITSSAWDWMPLADAAGGDDGVCDVGRRNLGGIEVAPWSNHFVFWGGYSRAFNPSSGALTGESGGLCRMDLGSHVVNQLIDPHDDEYSIGAVAPHPDLADTYMVLPKRDGADWFMCQQVRADTAVDLCPDLPAYSILFEDGAGWHRQNLPDIPPAWRVSSAVWGPTCNFVPACDSVAVGTNGGGTWRGKVSW